MEDAKSVSVAIKGRGADVFGDAVGQEQSAAFAVFRQIYDALGESIAGVCGFGFRRLGARTVPTIERRR